MIDWIASAADPRLDPYRRVADPHWVRGQGLFVAEGRLVVERLLGMDRFRVQSILVNRAAHDAMRPLLAAAPTTVLACDDPTLESITGYNFHRGCLALVYRPADLPASALHGARRLLGVENIANPDNIGGLFRSAAAFAVDGVVLNATSGDPLYRKAVRTAMGASLRVRYARAEPWLPALAAVPRAWLQNRRAEARRRRPDTVRVRGDGGEGRSPDRSRRRRRRRAGC